VTTTYVASVTVTLRRRLSALLIVRELARANLDEITIDID
jgi:hypothetical protein